MNYDESQMEFDRDVLSRARLARDARFDGTFYIGVLTTRIYCRPMCRSRVSKEENVCYFPTAAAAAEAGFRPCLRCRPECSPGIPAWAGTSNTVSRALRLISETGLENSGIEALAGHLGIGSPHLRRLFLKHLGASPRAVAQTRRLHFAKRLIDETNLSMTQIAVAAGFGSVRRFNAAIRATYQRTPTQIRGTRRDTPQAENEYLFRLPFRPPFDWHALLNFLARRATPGVEVIESGVYRRSISINGHLGAIAVSLEEETNSLAVRILLGDACALFAVIERIRCMFDLNADWPAIAQPLRKDPALKPLIDARPGGRVPGCWNGFELATRAILGQQVGSGRHNARGKTRGGFR
jgi:AraC family transcriptional regulator of adaptative response / DNA-3-methyladenine glycosylase II